jgi:single-stranded-DNA-specific exonuclease
MDQETADKLTNELHIDPLVARLLTVRGISTKEEAEFFLAGGSERLHDPMLLRGMKEAVERIQLALVRGEKIRIYGDYDADGVCSTSLMVHLMRRLQADFDYYIPHRIHEGYGLHKSALDAALKKGISLIVTVDNGISAVEQIKYASELGIDVIVTDHHEPPDVLPEAAAVINPKQRGCAYPFKQLAGAGVALKLAESLLGTIPQELLELAAIGTIADLMPLVGENRSIVKQGLKYMQDSCLIGVRALLAVSGIDGKEITASHIGFSLAPRINASGRLDQADEAVKLLTTTNEQEAEHAASDLDLLNKERARIVEDITKQALTQMEEYKEHKVIVLAAENWNVGVVGIVASKIVEKFYRPTLVLNIDAESGLAKGSARSIEGFDMYQALKSCDDLLEHYGGHQAAAGMTLQADRIDEFRQRLNQLADQLLTAEHFVPMISADLTCSLDEVDLEQIELITALAPFGMGNPSPKFIFNGLQVKELRTIGKDQKHLKLSVSHNRNNGAALDAVAFHLGVLADEIASTSQVDVLGELSINEWNGMRKPQIFIQDIRVPHVQIFDWRGAGASSSPESAMNAALNRWQGDPGSLDAAARGLLLSHEDELQLIPRSIRESGCSFWYVGGSGEISAANKAAQNISYGELVELYLFSLPARLMWLQSALHKAHSVQRIYAIFYSFDKQIVALPSREAFKNVYAILKQHDRTAAKNQWIHAVSTRSGLSRQMVEFILDVFHELSFVEREGEMYRCNASPGKKSLDSSSLYMAKVHMTEVEQTLVYSTAGQIADWMAGQLKNNHSLMEDIV